jgi:hypothetical protein
MTIASVAQLTNRSPRTAVDRETNEKHLPRAVHIPGRHDSVDAGGYLLRTKILDIEGFRIELDVGTRLSFTITRS